MRKESPVVRFKRRFRKSEGCWEWLGYVNKGGKGVVWVGRTCIYAPRFSYMYYVGPIPGGLYVCHTCNNPACVRPDHLFLGTQDDNMKDMKSKDRANRPIGESNGRAKLDEDAVRFIRQNYKPRSKEFGQKQLAVRFGVSTFTIQEVLYHNKWTHVE